MHPGQQGVSAAANPYSTIEDPPLGQPGLATTAAVATHHGSLLLVQAQQQQQQQQNRWQSLDTAQLHQDFLLQGLIASRSQYRPSSDGGHPASSSYSFLQAGGDKHAQPDLPPSQQQSLAMVMETLATQQQQHTPEQPSQAGQQQQPLQLPSAFADARDSVFAAVAAAAAPTGSFITSSGSGRLLADRPASTIIGRTVTGELPIAPQDSHNSNGFVPVRAGSAPAVVAVAVDGAPADEQETKVLRHTRQLTCKTYLKRLNVTQFMSDHLLPLMEGSLRSSSQKAHATGTSKGATAAAAAQQHVRGSTDNSSAARRGSADGGSGSAGGSDEDYSPHSSRAAAGSGGSSSTVAGGRGPGGQQRSYEMLFKVQVKLVDAVGQIWPITYEGVLCAGQRHLRLTCGWSEFIKAKKLAIGDAITFERRGANRNTLAVAVQHAGQESETVYAGKLPEDEQIKVLVGSLRDAGLDDTNSPTAAPATTEARAAGFGQACGSGSGMVLRAKGKQRGKKQPSALTVLRGNHASLRKRVRGGKNDDYDEGSPGRDGDGSSGSGQHTDCTSRPDVQARLLNIEAQLKDGSTALRVNNADGRLIDSAATGVLGRPRSFTKRQNLNSSEGAALSPIGPANGGGLRLPTVSAAAGRAVAPEQDYTCSQLQPALQQQQQQQQQVQRSPWAQEQLMWQQPERRLLPPELLGSWSTYAAASTAAAAAPADAAPHGSRQYLRQVSHPVARREYQAAEQGVARSSSQQQGLQLPAHLADVAVLHEPHGFAASACLSHRSRLATRSCVLQPCTQEGQLAGLVMSASVPAPGSAAGLEGSAVLPGWQVSTGFVGASSATRYGSSYHQPYSNHTQLPSLTPDAAAAAAAAPGCDVSSPVVQAAAAGTYSSAAPCHTGHQPAMQQQFGSTAPRQYGTAGPGSTGGTLPRQQQQQGYDGSIADMRLYAACSGPSNVGSLLLPQQAFGAPTAPPTACAHTYSGQLGLQTGKQQEQRQVVKLEDVVDPRGVWNPALLAPPIPRQQQQQQVHQLPANPAPPMLAPMESTGGLSYSRSIQMQEVPDETGVLQLRQQQQQLQGQPAAGYTEPIRQQPSEFGAAKAEFLAAAGGDLYNDWGAEPNPFLQHQQQQTVESPEADQLSVGAMESGMLVDTLLQLLAEPSVNMTQAGSLTQEQQQALKSLTEEQQQALQQQLQQAQVQPQPQLGQQEQGLLQPQAHELQAQPVMQAPRSIMQAWQQQQQQQQQQDHQRDGPMQQQQLLRSWQQQQQTAPPALAHHHQQQMAEAAAGRQQQGQLRAHQSSTLLQQWQQQHHRPQLAPPTLLPMEAVAAAAAAQFDSGG